LSGAGGILLFIPAYRCEKQIGRVLGQITPEVAREFGEVLVVENRSPDRTLEAARQGLKNISGCKTTLLQNDDNYSLGGSHKVAFNYCLEKGHDFVAVLHGDDQGSIADLLPLIAQGEHFRFENLLGARFAPGARLEGYSRFRTFGNIVFNKLISLAAGTEIYDMGAGLNMYKADFLAGRFYMGFPDDLNFNIHMLYYAVWKKASLRFFPITWREDDQISNAKIFKMAWRYLGLTKDYLLNAEALFRRLAAAPSKEYTSRVIPLG
jgi:glycosyltransferase involved in cell wall biosynthesis